MADHAEILAKLPADWFGYRGWRYVTAPKGRSRVHLPNYTSTNDVWFTVRVFNVDTQTPHSTTFWRKGTFGKNRDKAKGSSVRFRVHSSTVQPIYAWRSRAGDLIFFYRVESENTVGG